MAKENSSALPHVNVYDWSPDHGKTTPTAALTKVGASDLAACSRPTTRSTRRRREGARYHDLDRASNMKKPSVITRTSTARVTRIM
jgi:translation elongation factor EF-Tu-like GTPase